MTTILSLLVYAVGVGAFAFVLCFVAIAELADSYSPDPELLPPFVVDGWDPGAA
jgi:hypothetical protein